MTTGWIYQLSPLHWAAIVVSLGAWVAAIVLSARWFSSYRNKSFYTADGAAYADYNISKRKKAAIILTIVATVIALITFVFFWFYPPSPSSTPAGDPLKPSVTTTEDGTGEPSVENLSAETQDTQDKVKDTKQSETDSVNSQALADEAAAVAHNFGNNTSDFLTGETKGYYVPAVNPTEDEITEYLKDFDLEVGYDHSLNEQRSARIQAAAQFSGKYTDPVNFPIPEEYRTGFRKAAEGKLSQEELDALDKKFRHWLVQEMISNPPYGEMVLQTLNKLERVTKNNPWISQNEAIIDAFYAGTYQQPQVGDKDYAKLMKIELNAIPTDPEIKGLDYLLQQADETHFKPRVSWARLMARTGILIDTYFDVEGYVQYETRCNWHLPDYKNNNQVRMKEAPYQVDEPAILFAYHHTTGEQAEFGTGEFGVVEDDARTELYATKKAPPKENPSTPPDSTPKPGVTPTPPPGVTPTPTPTSTPTPTPTPTPSPTPSKDPSKDPANQGNVPIGGGSNSDPTNPGETQPTKPPAISTPGQGGKDPMIDTTGGGQHNSTGTGGNPNSVTNPNGNTINGDHPGQQPDAAASGSKPVTGTDNGTGQGTTANTNPSGATDGAIKRPD